MSDHGIAKGAQSQDEAYRLTGQGGVVGLESLSLAGEKETLGGAGELVGVCGGAEARSCTIPVEPVSPGDWTKPVVMMGTMEWASDRVGVENLKDLWD